MVYPTPAEEKNGEILDLKYRVLDVGCGSRPHGNFNLDMGIGANKHHKHDYDVRSIPGFTRGALPYLPYKDNVFDAVMCAHVLEHLRNPLEGLKELHRVTKGLAVLIVPNNPVFEEFQEHLYSWSKESFKNFCLLEFQSVEVRTQCRWFQIEDYRLFRKLLKIGHIKKPLSRWVSRVMAVEIVAICVKKPRRRGQRDNPVVYPTPAEEKNNGNPENHGSLRCSFHEDEADEGTDPCPHGMPQPCPLQSSWL